MFKQLLATILKALARRHAAGPLHVAARASDEDDVELVRGCGWFDSSHDLHAGLYVHEHASPDAVASDLPLADWLEMQLSGWRLTPAV